MEKIRAEDIIVPSTDGGLIHTDIEDATQYQRSQETISLLGNVRADTPPIQLRQNTMPYGEVYTQSAMGNLLPRYDNFVAGIDNEERLAREQGAGEAWARGSGRFLSNTLLRTVGNLAALPVGVVSSIVKGNVSALYDNGFTEILQEMEDRTNASLNIYYTKQERDAGFFKSLGSSAFLADQLLDGVSFLTSAVLSAYLAGGIMGTPASTAGGVSKAGMKQLMKAQSKTAVRKMLSKAARLKGVTTATNQLVPLVLSSSYEATVEARDILNTAQEEFIQQHMDIYGEAPSKVEADAFRGEAEAQGNIAFGVNLAILSASNYVQFGKALGMGAPKIAGAMRGNLSKAFYGLGSKQLVNGTFKAIKPALIQKTLGVAVGVLKNPISEALEEGSQFIIQENAKNTLESKFDLRGYNEVLSISDSLLRASEELVTSKEGQKSMGLGALIGLLGSGVTGRTDSGKLNPFGIKTYTSREAEGEAWVEGVNKVIERIPPEMLRRLQLSSQQMTLASQGNTSFDTEMFQALLLSEHDHMTVDHSETFAKVFSGLDIEQVAREGNITNVEAQEEVAKLSSLVATQYTQFKDAYRTASALVEGGFIPSPSDEVNSLRDTQMYKDLTIEALARSIYLGKGAEIRGGKLRDTAAQYIGVEAANDLFISTLLSEESKKDLQSVIALEHVGTSLMLQLQNGGLTPEEKLEINSKYSKVTEEIQTKKKSLETNLGLLSQNTIASPTTVGSLLETYSKLDIMVLQSGNLSSTVNVDGLAQTLADMGRETRLAQGYNAIFNDLNTEEGQRKLKDIEDTSMDAVIASIFDPQDESHIRAKDRYERGELSKAEYTSALLLSLSLKTNTLIPQGGGGISAQLGIDTQQEGEEALLQKFPDTVPGSQYNVQDMLDNPEAYLQEDSIKELLDVELSRNGVTIRDVLQNKSWEDNASRVDVQNDNAQILPSDGGDISYDPAIEYSNTPQVWDKVTFSNMTSQGVHLGYWIEGLSLGGVVNLVRKGVQDVMVNGDKVNYRTFRPKPGDKIKVVTVDGVDGITDVNFEVGYKHTFGIRTEHVPAFTDVSGVDFGVYTSAVSHRTYHILHRETPDMRLIPIDTDLYDKDASQISIGDVYKLKDGDVLSARVDPEHTYNKVLLERFNKGEISKLELARSFVIDLLDSEGGVVGIEKAYYKTGDVNLLRSRLTLVDYLFTGGSVVQEYRKVSLLYLGDSNFNIVDGGLVYTPVANDMNVVDVGVVEVGGNITTSSGVEIDRVYFYGKPTQVAPIVVYNIYGINVAYPARVEMVEADLHARIREILQSTPSSIREQGEEIKSLVSGVGVNAIIPSNIFEDEDSAETFISTLPKMVRIPPTTTELLEMLHTPNIRELYSSPIIPGAAPLISPKYTTKQQKEFKTQGDVSYHEGAFGQETQEDEGYEAKIISEFTNNGVTSLEELYMVLYNSLVLNNKDVVFTREGLEMSGIFGDGRILEILEDKALQEEMIKTLNYLWKNPNPKAIAPNVGGQSHDVLQGKIASMAEEVSQLRMEITQKGADVAAAQQSLVETQAKLATNTQDIKDATADVAEAEANVTSALNDVSESVEEKRLEVERLKAERTQLETAGREPEVQAPTEQADQRVALQEADMRLSIGRASLKRDRDKAENIKKEISAGKEKIADAQDKVKALESQIASEETTPTKGNKDTTPLLEQLPAGSGTLSDTVLSSAPWLADVVYTLFRSSSLGTPLTLRSFDARELRFITSDIQRILAGVGFPATEDVISDTISNILDAFNEAQEALVPTFPALAASLTGDTSKAREIAVNKWRIQEALEPKFVPSLIDSIDHLRDLPPQDKEALHRVISFALTDAGQDVFDNFYGTNDGGTTDGTTPFKKERGEILDGIREEEERLQSLEASLLSLQEAIDDGEIALVKDSKAMEELELLLATPPPPKIALVGAVSPDVRVISKKITTLEQEIAGTEEKILKAQEALTTAEAVLQELMVENTELKNASDTLTQGISTSMANVDGLSQNIEALEANIGEAAGSFNSTEEIEADGGASPPVAGVVVAFRESPTLSSMMVNGIITSENKTQLLLNTVALEATTDAYWLNNATDIKIILYRIEDVLVSSGIDFVGLTDMYDTKTREEIVTYITQFVAVYNSGEIFNNPKDFSTRTDAFFQRNTLFPQMGLDSTLEATNVLYNVGKLSYEEAMAQKLLPLGGGYYYSLKGDSLKVGMDVAKDMDVLNINDLDVAKEIGAWYTQLGINPLDVMSQNTGGISNTKALRNFASLERTAREEILNNLGVIKKKILQEGLKRSELYSTMLQHMVFTDTGMAFLPPNSNQTSSLAAVDHPTLDLIRDYYNVSGEPTLAIFGQTPNSKNANAQTRLEFFEQNPERLLPYSTSYTQDAETGIIEVDGKLSAREIKVEGVVYAKVKNLRGKSYFATTLDAPIPQPSEIPQKTSKRVKPTKVKPITVNTECK